MASFGGTAKYNSYLVDNHKERLAVTDAVTFEAGRQEVLVERYGDLCSDMPWFERGFDLADASLFLDLDALKLAVEQLIVSRLLSASVLKRPEDFAIESYHRHVDQKSHARLVKDISKLHPTELKLDMRKLLSSVGSYLQVPVTSDNIFRRRPQHVVLRCVRPNSADFNPPHKDVYGVYDERGILPLGINLWVPICGVSLGSTLCVVPGSHLLPESEIQRSRAGASLMGNKYHVNCIKTWGGDNSLIRISPPHGKILLFTPNLIHGLGLNKSKVTRFVVEIRLYKKDILEISDAFS